MPDENGHVRGIWLGKKTPFDKYARSKKLANVLKQLNANWIEILVQFRSRHESVSTHYGLHPLSK
jgi:hypothetical protein